MRRRAAAASAAARSRRGGLVLAVTTFVVGVIVTGLFYTGLRVAQHENADRVMGQRAAMALAAVRTETERYRSLVAATAAGLATDPEPTLADFDAATAPLASAGLIGAATVAFVAPSTTADIPRVQELWRQRGSTDLELQPVAGSGEHYFSIFTRRINAVGPPRNGIDVTGSPEAAAALTEARRLGRLTVSDTYVLLRDRNLPVSQQQLSFIFAAPISYPYTHGWLVLGLRGEDFLTGVLATASQGQLDGQLLATNRDGSRPVVAEYRVPGDGTLERRDVFHVADREWTLITRAEPGALPGAGSSLPPAVLVGGLAISLILAGLVWTLATGRTRAWQRVQEATAELRTAEEESRRQAGLLSAIMTSIGDGVGVVDETGAFLLHNPAAKHLLGIGEDSDDPASWQTHYGLFRPDGRTPFPTEELPLIRALAGESSDRVEMLIRNANRPEGILISVDGRPLDASAGLVGAVAVFHDITDLRRYEHDLAIFAGVVAHDLKAPLAVIRGRCETVIEDLAEVPETPDVAEARDGLHHIVRAVDRMAGLIDTLLAYSTARDAPLRTGAVDLSALVAEVVHDRVAHLPAADRPEVVIGPLAPVRADPAMLRHVLDNVVGNALKYVRPGTRPRVGITAEADGHGLVRVVVADRGIGIPDADKDEVFETFHRAHAGAGYAGTGLGLAICKRIVERHGGEIGVADNPGGGTQLFFTLPGITSSDEEAGMPDKDDDEARERLQRALAEREAMAAVHLPGLAPVRPPEPEREPGNTPAAGSGRPG